MSGSAAGELVVRTDCVPTRAQVLALYLANEWSSAEKPDALMQALEGSDCVATAWLGDELVGLANALSDGALVVYYPHMLVSPKHHRRGVGRAIMQAMHARYGHLHQQILVADEPAVPFYESMGFEIAPKTRPMWIYDGDDHD